MDHACFSDQAAEAQFPGVPFADERNRYLHHCGTLGARPEVLRLKRNELMWIARHLGPEAAAGVGMAQLLPIAQARQNLHGAVTATRRVIDIGRPWLKFLGWWRELFGFGGILQVDGYSAYTRSC